MSSKFSLKSLKKSRSFINTAREEILTGSINSGVNSLYYSAFQAVCAVVLMEEEVTNSSGIVTEKQVLDYLARKKLEDLAAFYKKLLHLKQNASANYKEVLSTEEAIQLIDEVVKFNHAIGAYGQGALPETLSFNTEFKDTDLASYESASAKEKKASKRKDKEKEKEKVYLYEVELLEALSDINVSTEKREKFHQGVIGLGNFITIIPVSANQFNKLLDGSISFVFLPHAIASFIEILETNIAHTDKSAKATGRIITARITYTEKVEGSNSLVGSFKPVIFKETDE